MSIQLDITERQLKFGIIRLGLSVAFLMILGAFVVSLIARSSMLSNVAINALLFAVAFSFLIAGIRSFLSIIDWFEKRRAARDSVNG